MSVTSSILNSPEDRADQQLLATDYLPVIQKSGTFAEKVAALQITPELATNILSISIDYVKDGLTKAKRHITEANEHELASEVLLARHDFTNQLLSHPVFRQAALSVIQNIYLFKLRKLFFHANGRSTEVQRQLALQYFSDIKSKSIPLADTLQHPIVARIWRRIIQSPEISSRCDGFQKLHHSVDRLNTLRNCYMLLATGLARKTAAKQPAIYSDGLPFEDAVQVGIMGIGRAAYRYHPSFGVRFSTYATNYINREIQQQALKSRLIRISSNTIEKFQHAVRHGDTDQAERHGAIIATSSVSTGVESSDATAAQYIKKSTTHSPIADQLEKKELYRIIHQAIETKLSPKATDFLKRRYGFSPYRQEQSIIEISQVYGVTRSALYQFEKSVMGELQNVFAAAGEGAT